MSKYILIFLTAIFFLFFVGTGCISIDNSANHDQENITIKKVLEKHDVWKDWDDFNIDTTSAIDSKHPNLSLDERNGISHKARKKIGSLKNETIGKKIIFWNLTENSRIKDNLPLERQADLSRDEKYDVIFVIEDRATRDTKYFSTDYKKMFDANSVKAYYEVVHWPAGTGEGIDIYSSTPPYTISSSDFHESIYDGPLNPEKIAQFHLKFSEYIARLPVVEYPDTPIIPPGPKYKKGDLIAEHQNSITAYMVTGIREDFDITKYNLERYMLEAGNFHGANQTNKGNWISTYGAGGFESMEIHVAEKEYPVLMNTPYSGND